MLVSLACGLMACSHEKPQPPGLSGVYGRIHQSWQDYEKGVELILSGNDMAGENLLAAATTRLVVAVRECGRTPGCDTDLFTDAMEQLVAEQRFARRGTALEMAAATASVGLIDPDEIAAEPPPDALPTTAKRSLLNGAQLDELIPMNRRVKAALNDWLTWDRPALMEAWHNYHFLRQGVAPVYEEAGLPEALLFAMMAKESGAKVHAYSRVGAAGPLQFMLPTGQRYGLGAVNGFDTRLDAVAATRANARYMKDLLRRFHGSLELALAAYNMGETRLRRVCQREGVADFWDPRVYQALSWETRNYVPKVLAVAWLFLHPDDHGLEFPGGEATSTTIVLEEAASLGELTVCLGQSASPDGWFRTLRNLNPRMAPEARAPAGTSLELPTYLVSLYSERCVGDAPLIRLARELHDADYPEKPELTQSALETPPLPRPSPR